MTDERIAIDDRAFVLHVGMPKTGTTSIQFAMREHPDALAQLGWTYSTVGRGERIHHLELINALGFARGSDGVGETARDVATRLRSEFDANPRLIVSHESLCKFPLLGPDQRSFVTELFRSFDPHVVLYVRRQDKWLESLYTQFVKRGRESRPIGEVADEFGQPYNGFATDYLDALDFFSGFVEGRSRLHVRVFDRSALVGGDAVPDFFSILGFDPEDSPPPPELNPSLSPLAVNVVRRMSGDDHVSRELTAQDFETVARLIDRSVPDDVESGPLLASSSRSALLDRCRPVNEAFLDRIAVPHGELLLENPTGGPEDGHEDPDAVTRALWRALASLYAHRKK
ncbi:MAG: hypothetical protein R3324_01285 [Halobacteriales archaeon]|nr:hypothetical protein [Halobacteriales archaeon]